MPDWRVRAVALLLAGSLLPGCFLQREGQLQRDASPERDAGRTPDAGREDAGRGGDAGPIDAATDAVVPTDAPDEPDTGPPCVIESTTVCDDPGVDEDCDGQTDEACDCNGGLHAGDVCTNAEGTCSGVAACTPTGASCALPDPIASVCNGKDDDCDGSIDENSGCGRIESAWCYPYRYEGSSYLLCDTQLPYDDAREYCMRYGYDLAVIEDAAEHESLLVYARSVRGDRRWYLGYHDLDDDGMYEWVRGSSSYVHPGFRAREGECAALDAGDEDWDDRDCGGDGLFFICEVDPS